VRAPRTSKFIPQSGASFYFLRQTSGESYDSEEQGNPQTVAEQQKIQAATDRHDRLLPKKTDSKALPKTSDVAMPANPLPAQHLQKPGLESNLRPRPKLEASTYRGSGKLQGKVALITGGDSGIGRSVAVLFAREGADVAIAYLNEHADARETAKYVEQEGRRCLLLPGDVCDAAFCENAVEATVAEFGKLHVLVNNAAFQGSETGLFGSKHLLDYSATKGAIHAFTKSLAANVIGRGIRVNAVAPGPVWTPLNLPIGPRRTSLHLEARPT
jgi:hypothetical protein